MINRKHLRSFVGLGVIVSAWFFLVPENFVLLPPLSEVAHTFNELLSQGPLVKDTIASLARVLAGVAIATVIALILGAITAYWRPFADFLSGGVELIRPVPPIAWTPLAIIAFGVGASPAIAIVALGAFFPIWLGIRQGLTEVRQSHLLAARSLGARWRVLMSDIIVPSVLPYAFHGLRLGMGLGWFCVVAAEMMGASSGLGYGIQLFSLNIEMPKLYSYLVVIGLMGYLSNSLLQIVDQRLSHWRGDI